MRTDRLWTDGASSCSIQSLETLYRDPELEIEPLKATFRDYIMYREELKKTDKYKQDREFLVK